jgi:hypothetical protein
MTNDDIAYLRLLADWHDRQARYLLLTVPANVFHTGLRAPLSVIQAPRADSMGGKNSVNNRCRIAKHFRPK